MQQTKTSLKEQSCEQLAVLYKETASDEVFDEIVARFANFIDYCSRYFAKHNHKAVAAGCDAGDLAVFGKLGLYSCLPKYDPSTGMKLFTYAKTFIIGYMLNEVRPLMGVPRTISDKWSSAIAKSVNQFVELSAIPEPDMEEFCQYLNWLNPVRLNKKCKTSIGEIGDYIMRDPYGENNIIEEVALSVALSKLPPRDRTIFELKVRGLSQTDISKLVGISQMHVSRIIRQHAEFLLEQVRG